MAGRDRGHFFADNLKGKWMSIRRIAVVVGLTTLILSGCVPNQLKDGLGLGSSSDRVTTTPPDTRTAENKSLKTDRAANAAITAIGGTVVEKKGAYMLCSLVDQYPMCDGRPCRKDGLTATTYFVCRESKCAGKEIPTPNMPNFSSHASCVAGCRRAETQARGKRIASETHYCAH